MAVHKVLEKPASLHAQLLKYAKGYLSAFEMDVGLYN